MLDVKFDFWKTVKIVRCKHKIQEESQKCEM